MLAHDTRHEIQTISRPLAKGIKIAAAMINAIYTRIIGSSFISVQLGLTLWVALSLCKADDGVPRGVRDNFVAIPAVEHPFQPRLLDGHSGPSLRWCSGPGR
jgi:hypothetical protein